ncbi:MAG: hypothetical protein C6P37_07615 [Caldibacillus debilis]|uniref:Uncharacterized protein n=1 Tax=Caldibacillus debilis TaxID=301148 RepID=A0A3E0K4P9_9BACI|nr:MAG: hypothetical protein C6P37_07615 [Caldibacillus debilis]
MTPFETFTKIKKRRGNLHFKCEYINKKYSYDEIKLFKQGTKKRKGHDDSKLYSIRITFVHMTVRRKRIKGASNNNFLSTATQFLYKFMDKELQE